MAPRATVDLNWAHGLSQIMHCISEIFCVTLYSCLLKSQFLQNKQKLYLMTDKWKEWGEIICRKQNLKHNLLFSGTLFSFPQLCEFIMGCFSLVYKFWNFWLLLGAFAELTQLLTKHHFCNVCNPSGFFSPLVKLNEYCRDWVPRHFRSARSEQNILEDAIISPGPGLHHVTGW